VLFEMLTGQRAFQGATAADTMTAILREDPPELSGVRAESVPALDRIVRHCLEKNPAERFQTARDVAFALEAFSGTTMTTSSGAVAALPAPRRRASWLLVGAAAIAALAAGVLLDRAFHPEPKSIAFETKTWDEEWISNARFAPDGETIVYSAVRENNSPGLYALRPGIMTAQPLGEPDTHLLSVSSKGELAVITHARATNHRLFRGTLARMTMDGAPRPWLEDVSEADWSPDGETAAITRVIAGGGMQLEYPVGQAHYAVTSGYLSDIRVSPEGGRVAFFEHQIPGDDRGWVKVVSSSGPPKTLAGEYFALEGLAWSADGRSLYFSGSAKGAEGMQAIVVNAEGTPVPRQAIASAGGMLVQDVSRQGRVLVMREDLRGVIRALVPGDRQERDLPWLDFTYQGYQTRDGKYVIFGDQSQSAGANYAVTLRDLATSRVTRLGEGTTMPLSPDDRWAAALIPSGEQIVLYPIGAGEPIKLAKGAIEHYRPMLQWFPDSQRVLVCGTEAGKPVRCYEQDLRGSPKPIGPEGVSTMYLAGDGRTVLARRADRTNEVLTLGQTSGTTAKGLTDADIIVGWADNGRELVVQDIAKVPTPVALVDPATGARRMARMVGPTDRPGTRAVLVSQWIGDGRGYTYSYFLDLSKLFVATGVGQ